MSQCPDEVIPLLVTTCPHGQMDLTPIAASSIERRQVGDVPVPRVQVTEDQAEEQQCPHCHQQTRAAFPAGVGVPVQYGPRVGTMAVYLLIQQRLPWGRTREVLAERLGVPMSEGSLAPLVERTAQHLEGVETQIKAALRQARVIHQDETGRSVKKRRVWMHGTSTRHVTHDQVHESRGKKALEANGILPSFTGVSVHDC